MVAWGPVTYVYHCFSDKCEVKTHLLREHNTTCFKTIDRKASRFFRIKGIKQRAKFLPQIQINYLLQINYSGATPLLHN